MILLDSLNTILRFVEIVAACYSILIGLFAYGWFRLKASSDFELSNETTVSVLVAARNEANTIGNLIADLARQNYPQQLYEVIFVDDHSEDETYNNIQEICANHGNFVLLRASEQGKKAAMAQALAEAKGALILVTDADCRVSADWVRCMVSYYEKERPKMILGPVLLTPSKTLFERFQTLEHLSLIGSTAGAAALAMPIMCNGANMAYERKAARDVAILRKDADLVSGDDMFLMQAIAKKFGAKSVQFIRNEQCIVTTVPSKTVRDFFRQRMRWVSKSKGYTSLRIIATALMVFLFNLNIVMLFVLSFFMPALSLFVFLFLLLKTLVDFPLLYGMCAFMKQQKLTRFIIPLEFVYPFYIVLSGVFGLFGKPSWKGRKAK
ncbi:MAG: glycosyltransferase [Lentimicrobiaceae bacterium]|jgi:cellulose synthase/poly-beta-1,6-N-acetylglucosamine synthase-like glycosyltransferase|nr:glycosyltransferase [Lentimicrobiaceae bacterium]